MASPKNNAPKGFKQVDNSLSGFWKPSKAGQHLQGVVRHMIESKNALNSNGKPNQFYAIRLTSPDSGPIIDNHEKDVTPEEGMLIGVGGAVLLNFLAERVGKEVYLVYKGLGKAKKGQSAPKMYETYEREFDEATGEVVTA